MGDMKLDQQYQVAKAKRIILNLLGVYGEEVSAVHIIHMGNYYMLAIHVK
jgi:hypothetical protein